MEVGEAVPLGILLASICPSWRQLGDWWGGSTRPLNYWAAWKKQTLDYNEPSVSPNDSCRWKKTGKCCPCQHAQSQPGLGIIGMTKLPLNRSRCSVQMEWGTLHALAIEQPSPTKLTTEPKKGLTRQERGPGMIANPHPICTREK